jgi:hypothetical protein
MRPRQVRQMKLFEGQAEHSVHVSSLQTQVAQQATRELVQWMRALARAMSAGAGDEQNNR